MEYWIFEMQGFHWLYLFCMEFSLGFFYPDWSGLRRISLSLFRMRLFIYPLTSAKIKINFSKYIEKKKMQIFYINVLLQVVTHQTFIKCDLYGTCTPPLYNTLISAAFAWEIARDEILLYYMLSGIIYTYIKILLL